MYTTNVCINLPRFHSYVMCNVKIRIKGQSDTYLLLRTDGVNLTVELDDGACGAMGYKAVATPSGSVILAHDESHSCLLQLVSIIRGSFVES